MSLYRKAFPFFLFIFPLMLHAQKDSSRTKYFQSQRIFSFQVQFQKHSPLADMRNRTASFSEIGGGVFYKSNANFQYGVQAGYLYGSNIKDYSSLKPITTSNGTVIDIDGYENVPLLIFKGFSGNFYLGRLFPFSRNKNSGLLVQLGLGYMRHKAVLSNSTKGIVQTQGNKMQGYERMVGGMNVYSYVGYQHISMKRALNFSVGLTYNAAQTNPLVNYDYATRGTLQGKRKDSSIGIKIAWMIPIFLQNKGQEEFYFY